MQDLKIKDKMQGPENAGPENAGAQKRDRKLKDKLPNAIRQCN